MSISNRIVGQGWLFPPQIGPTGSLALTHENNELDQAIRIILSTSPGERVMRPSFGCQLHELVFAPNNRHTAAQARRYVEEALGMWEPRITVTNVTVQPNSEDANCLLIGIQYEIKSTHDPRSLVHPFYLAPDKPQHPSPANS